MGKAIATLSILLAWCASSSAASFAHTHHHRHRHRRHHVHHFPPVRVISVTGGGLSGPSAPASASAPLPSPERWDNAGVLIALGDVPGCASGKSDPVPYLESYGAQVLRLVVSPDIAADGASLPCVIDAVTAGYKVSLVIGYDNSWSTSETLGYFEGVLEIYGSYAWAISIGNEQELNQDGSQTGLQYASIWRAVEPVLQREYPQAIRVAGEISPWGMPFLQAALVIGLPGAQALAGHPYARPHGFAPMDLATLAQTYRAAGVVQRGARRTGLVGRQHPALLDARRIDGGDLAELISTGPVPAGAPAGPRGL